MTNGEDLKQLVEAAMVADLALQHVQVRARGATVWLEGTVTNSAYRDRAARRAREVPGVEQIINDIAVEPQRGPLLEEFGEELLEEAEPGMPPLRATEDVMGSGAEAEPFVPPVDPVTRPTDGSSEGLEITGGFAFSDMNHTIEPDDVSPEPFTDGELRRRVLQALRRDAATSDLPIAVEVINGTAYLHGRVRFLQDAEAAEEVAGRIPGIIEVREELDVEGP